MRIDSRASLLALSSLVAAAAFPGLGGCDEDAATATSDPDSGAQTDAAPSGPKKVGDTCAKDDECEGRCTNEKCAPPTITDGKKSPSLGETDIDCGGPQAPKCATDKGCAADTDCTNGICGRQPNGKRCVIARSCGGGNGSAGMTTCGKGEVGEEGAAHESCCTSLPLPFTTTRALDRYEITAGRIREFIGVLSDQNGGDPDVRTWAHDYAAANPDSQLGKVEAAFPGILDILPDQGDPFAPLPLMRHLGALPVDAINRYDGCYVSEGAYGHPTYWQPPETLELIGTKYAGKADGERLLSREQLDEKPINCVMPLMLAAFCAWDGGELARASDFYEVWGRETETLTVTSPPSSAQWSKPWETFLSIGEFNFRNGRPESSCVAAGIPNFPGCLGPQPNHYMWPTGVAPSDDDSTAIGAPGRFYKDVTKLKSANGQGWVDIGGNMIESAWLDSFNSTGLPLDVCDMSSTTPGEGEVGCSRSIPAAGPTAPAETRYGVRRFAGAVPPVALIGYSFEGHAGFSDAYLRASTADEANLARYWIHFQYGKLTGRCARKLE